VIIMTSNIGTEFIGSTDVANNESVKEDVMTAVRTHFRPEFINRLDELMIFHPLGRQHIQEIVGIQLRILNGRMIDRAKIGIEATEIAAELLAEQGYDPQYGARPLKRVIQRQVENPLAVAILEREFVENDVVLIDVAGGELTFTKKEGTTAVA
ncbi:MAG: AAA domain-containing protein, partial [Candidatus Latescibacteria bacterium]|nr:AAA domain-containing protein [Candidatus Latescibacterota bacterium]